jgi:hypothetical protein
MAPPEGVLKAPPQRGSPSTQRIELPYPGPPSQRNNMEQQQPPPLTHYDSPLSQHYGGSPPQHQQFGAGSDGYQSQPSYGDDRGLPLPQQFGAPPPQPYGAPPSQHYQPPSYGDQRGVPPQHYGAPSQYGGPPQHAYGAPPPQYGGPPPHYGSLPPQYGGPPQQYSPYGGPPQHYGDPPPPGVVVGTPYGGPPPGAAIGTQHTIGTGSTKTGEPIKGGNMKKLGVKGITQWKNRYFKLYPTRLEYFSPTVGFKGSIALATVSEIQRPENGACPDNKARKAMKGRGSPDCYLQLITPNRVYSLNCTTNTQREVRGFETFFFSLLVTQQSLTRHLNFYSLS